MLVNFLKNHLTNSNSTDTLTSENKDSYPGKKGRPGYVGGSLPKASAEVINNAIADGKISTKLDSSKQSKHKKGSPKYNKIVAKGDYVSTIDIDDSELQKIIENKAGTGIGYSNGKQFLEVIDAEKKVGTYVSRKGKESETTKLTIHYSNSGCHAVPASPNK